MALAPSGLRKGKRKREKKNLNIKMVCFFLTQVTGNYSLPIMFSNSPQKNVPPPSIDRFTIPTIDLLSPKKEKKERKKKRKRKKKPLKSQQRSHHSGHTHHSSHDRNGASTSSIVITTSTSLLLFIEAILLLLFSLWSVTFVVLSSCGDFLCSGDWEGVAEG